MAGGARKAPRAQRKRRPLGVGRVLGVVLVLAIIGTAVYAALIWRPGSSEDARTPVKPTGLATPLADFDTTAVAVARAPFCDRVPVADANVALSASLSEATTYDNGDEAQLAPDLRDVAHEYGCVWKSAVGTKARAWVFVPPVSSARAAMWSAELKATPNCQVNPGAPIFGQDSVSLLCMQGTKYIASFSGLFGDAWLSCALEEPLDVSVGNQEDLLIDRTGRWCVSVAQAAATGSPASGTSAGTAAGPVAD